MTRPSFRQPARQSPMIKTATTDVTRYYDAAIPLGRLLMCIDLKAGCARTVFRLDERRGSSDLKAKG